MIKLIILDVDGVMTNGKKAYGADGQIISKEFCDKDWTAIKKLKVLGVNVLALSGDKFNEGIMRSRNIDFVHNILPKARYLNEICKKYKVEPDDIAYIGDDIFDVNIAKLIQYPFCPIDAVVELKDFCYVLGVNGGNNVIRYLFDYLADCKLIPQWKESYMDDLYKIDSKESKYV